MVKIPQYESKRSLSSLNLPREQEDQRVGNKMKEIGEKVQKIASEAGKMKMLREETQASNDLQARLNDINLRSAQDQNLDNKSKYEQEIKDAITSTAASISNNMARDSFMGKANAYGNTATFNLEKSYLAKEAEQAQDQLQIKYGTSINEYAYSTPDKQALIKVDFFNEVDNYVDENVISQQDGAEYKARFVKNADIQHAYALAETDYKSALQIIEQSALMTPDEKRKVKNNISSIGTRVEAERKEEHTQLKNENGRIMSVELNRLLRTNTISEGRTAYLDQLDTFLSTDQIELSVYNGLYKKATDISAFKPVTDNAVYDIADDMARDPNVTEEEFLAYTTENSDKLDEEDFQSLLGRQKTVRANRVDDVITSTKNGLKAWTEKTIGGKFTSEKITGIAKGEMMQITHDFSQEVLRQYDTFTVENVAEKTQQIYDNVVTDYLKKTNPDVANVDEIPNATFSIGGKVKRIFSGNSKAKPDYTITRNK